VGNALTGTVDVRVGCRNTVVMAQVLHAGAVLANERSSSPARSPPPAKAGAAEEHSDRSASLSRRAGGMSSNTV
jgi:hypothetical protein